MDVAWALDHFTSRKGIVYDCMDELAQFKNPPAGLIDNETIQSVTKIPVLGDIPLLGAFFRSKSAQSRQTELMVLIQTEPLCQVQQLSSYPRVSIFQLPFPRMFHEMRDIRQLL